MKKLTDVIDESIKFDEDLKKGIQEKHLKIYLNFEKLWQIFSKL